MQHPKPQKLTRILISLAQEDSKILVEGKRDEMALVNGGIDKSRIYRAAYRTCGYFEKLVSSPKNSRIVLLFDNDRSGRERTNRFVKYFNGYDAELDTSYMESFRRSGIMYVEELNSLL